MSYFLPCTIPEGQVGAWRVERFAVNHVESQISAMLSGFGAHRVREVPDGTYTRLVGPGGLWMSNTPSEEVDHVPPIRRAQSAGGHCLVTGLGLGLVTEALLAIPTVTTVTVIERAPEVVALVAPTLQARWGERLTVVTADAYAWRPPRGAQYSVVWHDIWVAICADNWPEMTRLKRRFARRTDWQGCWREWSVRRLARQERAEEQQRAAWRAMFRRGREVAQ